MTQGHKKEMRQSRSRRVGFAPEVVGHVASLLTEGILIYKITSSRSEGAGRRSKKYGMGITACSGNMGCNCQRMSNARCFLGVIVLITLCAPLVHAQNEENQFEGGVFGGVSAIPGDIESHTQVLGSADEMFRTVGVHYGSGYQFGARIAENLRDVWCAELEYSFANQPLRFTNLTPTVQSLSITQSVNHFAYNVAYLPPLDYGRFRPYGKIGVGATLFFLQDSSRDAAQALGIHLRDSWQFSFNWGGGLKFRANDQTVLIFDVRDFVSGVPSYGLPQSAQVVNGEFQPGYARHGFLNNVQVSVGVSFRWYDYR